MRWDIGATALAALATVLLAAAPRWIESGLNRVKLDGIVCPGEGAGLGIEARTGDGLGAQVSMSTRRQGF